MSDEPLRIRILTALTAELEKINPDNGYAHDLRERVSRGRRDFGELSGADLPFVTILQNPLTTGDPVTFGGAGNTVVAYPFNLQINGFAEQDPRHPSDPADRLMADVALCLARAAQDVREGRKFLGFRAVGEVQILERTATAPLEGSSVCDFVLELRLVLTEDLLNPFSQ